MGHPFVENDEFCERMSHVASTPGGISPWILCQDLPALVVVWPLAAFSCEGVCWADVPHLIAESFPEDEWRRIGFSSEMTLDG